MIDSLTQAARRLLDAGSVAEVGAAGPTGRRVVEADLWRIAEALANAFLKLWRLRHRSEWARADGWVLWWHVEDGSPSHPECIGPEPGVAADYRWWTPIHKPVD